MISRVAEHCFWLGRYVERADSTARVLYVTQNLALDAELTADQCWRPVLTVAGEAERFIEGHGELGAGDGELVQHYMTWDEKNPVSLWHTVRAARENARSIREVVSLETWQTLNELQHWLAAVASRADYRRERLGFYGQVRRYTQLCLGLMRATMLHDTPLDFIWLGVLLERMGQTARLLDVQHHALVNLQAHREVQTALWLSLLRACSGFEPFMKRQQGRVSREAVARFLLLDSQFPRSVAFCLRHGLERLRAIASPEGQPGKDGTPAATARATQRVEALAGWLGSGALSLQPDECHDVLSRIIDEGAAICELIEADLLGVVRPTSIDPVAQ